MSQREFAEKIRKQVEELAPQVLASRPSFWPRRVQRTADYDPDPDMPGWDEFWALALEYIDINPGVFVDCFKGPKVPARGAAVQFLYEIGYGKYASDDYLSLM